MKTNLTIIVFILICSYCSSCSQKRTWNDGLEANLNEIADSLSLNLKDWEIPDRIFKVKDFGALADSQTMNTEAIQKAIDSCSVSGAGLFCSRTATT